MSFNAKNLTYDTNEPSFLRKLKAEYGGANSVRHERPVARPRKQVLDRDEDDGPTYIVEGTQDVVSREEYEALIGNNPKEAGDAGPRKETEELKPAQDGHGTDDGDSVVLDRPNKEKIAGIGASNKRRLAKIVGADEDGEKTVAREKVEKGDKKVKPKKSKKIKLSFDEGPAEV